MFTTNLFIDIVVNTHGFFKLHITGMPEAREAATKRINDVVLDRIFSLIFVIAAYKLSAITSVIRYFYFGA